VGAEGSLYIADQDNQRIRRVGSHGIITTVAGTGTSGGFSGDGGPATQAQLNYPLRVAVGAEGSLYIADSGNSRIRQLRSSLPGFSVSDVLIAAEDGSELYHFNDTGRHLRTLDALTGAVRYQFAYDSAARLETITDGDGNVTTIERDGSGNPSTIVAPFGQRTTLAVQGDGYLSRVTNPAGEAVQLTYSSGTAAGLLATLTDPRGNVHRYTYDDLGRLVRDENPAGGVTTLARTDITDDHYTVTLTTALGRVTTYEVEELSTGDTRRVRIDPSGARTESLIRTDGSRRITYPDGTVANLVEGPDPRFDMQAPILKSLTVTTPGGITRSRAATRTATLSDPNNPLSLTSQIDTVNINGRTYTSTYAAASRTFTLSTLAGRQRTATLDAKGRLIQATVPGLTPVQRTYDNRGREDSLTQDDRSYALAYNSQGYLSLLTDPLARSVSFTYGAAGRPTVQIRPDNEQIHFAYDANGNMVSLTPPERPSHEFSYTPINLPQNYDPPDIGFTPKDTQWTYNLDRQLTQLSQPDASASVIYDTAGRVQSLTHPQDTVSYGYDSAGRLETLTTTSGTALTYNYDGSLLTDTSWSGPMTGTIHYTFDNDFRLTSQTVNAEPTHTFAYDADGLLTQAGALTLTRDTQNGFLTGTTLGVVSDTLSYNSFGEIMDYTASISATLMLSTQFTRDKLGRITGKSETVAGVTTTFDYDYDLAGRLIEVKQNGVTVSTYTYDANGNRLSRTTAGGTITGTYDVQDRLTQYGGITYTYTANGDLLTKTAGGQTITYNYDVLGTLRGVSVPGGTQVEYLIDGQNRRVGKKVNGTKVQGFLYQDRLKPVAELDGNDAIVSSFIYGSRPNVPDYLVKGGSTYRIIVDELGSPRLVVDTSTGAIVQQLDYDEFGNVFSDTNPGFQPFGFAGGLYDPHTQLVRFGARDYDAETGRWMTKDPVGLSGGLNVYAYVRNDPINLIDRTGRNATLAAGGAIAGGSLGAAAGGAALIIGGPVAAGVAAYQLFTTDWSTVADAIADFVTEHNDTTADDEGPGEGGAPPSSSDTDDGGICSDPPTMPPLPDTFEFPYPGSYGNPHIPKPPRVPELDFPTPTPLAPPPDFSIDMPRIPGPPKVPSF
jgi:RHS repeat-associated protein